MTNLKETGELVNYTTDTALLVKDRVKDGADVQDAIALIPQLLGAGPAITGLSLLDDEARASTPVEVEALFNAQAQKLIDKGTKPHTAYAIISSAKAAYYTYAAIEAAKEQGRQEARAALTKSK